MRAFLASGWTFFFRWPIFQVSADAFVPASLFLGPAFQAFAFALAAGAALLLPSAPVGLAGFLGFVVLSAWSGFFHDDGFADTADSLGVSKFDDSDATLDRIHAAMKDSRLGTFGVSALILLWAFRGLSAFLWGIDWATLAVIVFVSRSAAFGAAWGVGRYIGAANARRSSHLMMGIGARLFLAFLVATLGLLAAVGAFVPGLTPVRTGVWLGASGVLAVFFLRVQVRRCQGLSGDLIGAAVCLCEIFILVLCASGLP